MSCNLNYKNGKLTGVFDDQGNPSKLYQEAKNKFGEEKGLEIYLVSKSDSFIEVFGGNKNEKTILFNRVYGSFGKIGNSSPQQVFNAIKAYSDVEINELSPTVEQLRYFSEVIGRKVDNSEFNYSIIYEDYKVTEQEIKTLISKIDNKLAKINEPSLQTVLNYIAQNNRTEESLSKEELLDVFNASLISGEINPKDFYDKDGLFTIPKKYYTNYEYSNLVDDIELQKKVKQTVDKMLNTEEVIISDTKVENPEKTTQVTALGKLNILNPNVVKQEILDLAVQNNETEEQYLNAVSELGYSNTTIPFEETKQYKKAEVYYQTEEGEIVPAMKDGNIELTLPLVAKQTENAELIENIQFLSSKSLRVLEQNSEQTYTILKKIEDDLIKEGVDIIGITEQPINEELVSFLDDLGLFLVAPTKENMSNFISSHRNIFDLNSQEVKVKAVKEDRTDINLVELSNTSLTEEQVYEKAGLIKYKENLYIKTAKEDLETLYNNLSTYTEKYPSNKTLQEHVQEEIGKGDYQRFNNPEVAEAVFLYKIYFDVEGVKLNIEGVNFTENYEYLTGEYISDFYVDYLKEKQKDSTKWKNFYSNFEVTPLGITLKQTDDITLQQVKIMADENLKQYSIISKQMPLLAEETEPINKRDSLVNNPQQLEEYSGNSYIVDDNNIITNNSDNEFIRVGNDVYEATDAFENLVLYSKLKGEGKEGYYSFGAIQPKTEVNLKDYAYLHKQKDIFLKEEKYLTEEEKNQLKENKYNC